MAAKPVHFGINLGRVKSSLCRTAGGSLTNDISRVTCKACAPPLAAAKASHEESRKALLEQISANAAAEAASQEAVSG